MAYQGQSAVVKAERAVIMLAGKPVEVFRLPIGSYRYSPTSATSAVKAPKNDWYNYKASVRTLTQSENIQENGYDPYGQSPPQVVTGNYEHTPLVSVGRTRIRPLTDQEVAGYWSWKASNGNLEAKALLEALAIEALTRRADTAFNVVKSEETYEAETKAVREEILARYLAEHLAHLERGHKEDGYVFTQEAESVRYQLNAVFYQTMTELEREVIKERKLDLADPDWREGTIAGVDTVTDANGVFCASPQQIAYYKKRQECLDWVK